MTEKEMAESRFIASGKGAVFTPPQKVEERTMKNTIEQSYIEYLENINSKDAIENELLKIGGKLEALAGDQSEVYDLIAEYEELARRSGFYAGYKAAIENRM